MCGRLVGVRVMLVDSMCGHPRHAAGLRRLTHPRLRAALPSAARRWSRAALWCARTPSAMRWTRRQRRRRPGPRPAPSPGRRACVKMCVWCGCGWVGWADWRADWASGSRLAAVGAARLPSFLPLLIVSQPPPHPHTLHSSPLRTCPPCCPPPASLPASSLPSSPALPAALAFFQDHHLPHLFRAAQPGPEGRAVQRRPGGGGAGRGRRLWGSRL